MTFLYFPFWILNIKSWVFNPGSRNSSQVIFNQNSLLIFLDHRFTLKIKEYYWLVCFTCFCNQQMCLLYQVIFSLRIKLNLKNHSINVELVFVYVFRNKTTFIWLAKSKIKWLQLLAVYSALVVSVFYMITNIFPLLFT